MSTHVKCQDRQASEWEAAGLSWLAAAADSHGGAPVARVLDVTDEALTIEEVPPGSPSASAAREFGAALARTHGAGVEGRGFGVGPLCADETAWPCDGLQGPAGGQIPLELAQPGEFESWGRMYGRLRIAPLVRAAGATFSADERAVFGTVVARLDDGEFDDAEPPARIHGDLWSGNLLWGADGAVLIDPAAYAGHRECDLAALDLFGTPHLADIIDGYLAEHPLESGWRQRIGLHQLHLVLLHAVLFGGGYGGQALALARQYV